MKVASALRNELGGREDAGAGLPIAMFHYIARPPLNAPFRGLFYTPAAFRKLIRALSAGGASTVELSRFLAAREVPGREVALTFDDAAACVVADALPSLVSAGFSGTTFVVAEKIGGWNDWDWNLGAARVKLADREHLRDWIAGGQRIGSHGLSHRSLLKLAPAEARREIFESKERLENLFGIAIEDFCYPYGDMSEQVREMVAEAGYKTACSVVSGVNDAATDPFALRRRSIQHRRAWLAALCPGPLSVWC